MRDGSRCDYCGKPFDSSAFSRDWVRDEHYHHQCHYDYAYKWPWYARWWHRIKVFFKKMKYIEWRLR